MSKFYNVTIWVLLGLLALSTVLVTLGREDNATFPSAESNKPSGVKVFADLLRNTGTKVRVSHTYSADWKPGDVLVCFYLERRGFGGSYGPEEMLMARRIDEFVSTGGASIDITLRTPFHSLQESEALAPTEVVGAWANEKRKITLDTFPPSGTDWLATQDLDASDSTPPGDSAFTASDSLDQSDLPLWLNRSDEPVVYLSSRGKGWFVDIPGAIGVTNRYIDQGDNAKFFVETTKSLLGPDGEVVFVEAVFGNAASLSIVDALGPWAKAIQYQLAALFLVTVLAHGRRFGLPDPVRRLQSGTREMVDAVGDTLHYGKRYDSAMEMLIAWSEREIRSTLGIPSSSSKWILDPSIPPQLRDTLQAAKVSVYDKLPHKEMLDRANLLVAHTNEFCSAKKRQRRQRDRL